MGALVLCKLDPGCLSGAYCCVVVTEWERFKALTPHNFIEHMAQPVVIDARRILICDSFATGWHSAPLVWVTASPLTEFTREP